MQITTLSHETPRVQSRQIRRVVGHLFSVHFPPTALRKKGNEGRIKKRTPRSGNYSRTCKLGSRKNFLARAAQMSDRSRSLSRVAASRARCHIVAAIEFTRCCRCECWCDYRRCDALLANLKIAYSVVREPISRRVVVVVVVVVSSTEYSPLPLPLRSAVTREPRSFPHVCIRKMLFWPIRPLPPSRRRRYRGSSQMHEQRVNCVRESSAIGGRICTCNAYSTFQDTLAAPLSVSRECNYFMRIQPVGYSPPPGSLALLSPTSLQSSTSSLKLNLSTRERRRGKKMKR